MKKMVVLVCLFLSVTGYSQTDKHMQFMNVSIDGSLNEFISKMKEKKFSLLETIDDVAMMKGEFASEICELLIISSPITNTVWKVAVLFSKDDSWDSLEYDYHKYRNQYVKKYGEPKSSYEFFSSPYYDGDGYELQALRKDKCTYMAIWELDDGSIMVRIGSSGQIVVHYEDKINANIGRKEKDSRVQDDI